MQRQMLQIALQDGLSHVHNQGAASLQSPGYLKQFRLKNLTYDLESKPESSLGQTLSTSQASIFDSSLAHLTCSSLTLLRAVLRSAAAPVHVEVSLCGSASRGTRTLSS